MVKKHSHLWGGDYYMSILRIIEELKQHKVVPRLDGNRLKLTGETKNLSKQCIDDVKLHKEELLAFLKNAIEQSVFEPIPQIPAEQYYPLSNAQQRLWILSQFEGGTSAYNIIRSFYLKGTILKENLDKAFQAVIQRHESLRTVFRRINNEPRQVVSETMPFNIEYEDISALSDKKEQLKVKVEAATRWQLNLETGPLLKVKLFRLSAEEYAMIFCLHHIVSDGWSVGVMVQEVMLNYEAFCKAATPQLAPLKIQYKDYNDWLVKRLAGNKGDEARAFWKEEFAVIPEPLQLPGDYPRPAIRSFEGAITRFYFEEQLYSQIQDYCKRNQVTLFNFFRTVINVLLYRFSGQHAITIGTPVSGRNHFDLENQVGLYVNTLPLKMELQADETFSILLGRISEHSFSAFEFQDYPLDNIIEDVKVRRDTGRDPLFDVMMVLQNTAMGDGTINMNQQYGFTLSLLDHYLYGTAAGDKPFAAKSDLNFNFDTEQDNKFYLEIEYATSLFKKERIRQYYEAFNYIITQVLHNPEMLLRNIEITTRQERDRILHTFNTPIADIEEYHILDLLQPSFSSRMDKPAIIAGDNVFSYQEVQVFSANVASYLLSACPETKQHPFVALLMDRTEWMVFSILGTLQSGNAYVPVDVNYPVARIEYMLSDVQPACIIVDDRGIQLVPPGYRGRVIHLSSLQSYKQILPVPEKDRREQCAYLIYTSGSTGAPKGVEICHRNTIAFLKWAQKAYSDTDFEILYATTSYCFDLSVFEFFFPLIMGKTIRLLSSALDIPAVIHTDRKVMLNTVPSVVRTLLDQGMCWDNITALNMAGEPIPKKIKEDLDYMRMEVRNLYGPSEDTTYSTVYLFEDDDYSTIPIGTPVGYTQLYILDQYQQLLPEGVAGEIYLSGQSVAKGYYNREELSKERFLMNPFIPGMPMYKTGDTGRWLPDGKVEFTGRIDDQVKIRGYRIELGEIQYQLEKNPDVEQTVVIVKPVGDENVIVAYWVGSAHLTVETLKSYLMEVLPAYMVPSYWFQLESIPLNSNGKVDKTQLPDPLKDMSEETHIVLPSGKTEAQLLEIWKQVLKADYLGVTQNFFEAGGHSLKATILRSLIATSLGKDLTLNEIFAYPTIVQQAQLIDTKSATVTEQIRQITEQPWYPISFVQERLWILTGFEEASAAYNMPAAFSIQGTLDRLRLEKALQLVIAKHESLRTVFAERDGRPVQMILPPEDIYCPVEEVQLPHVLTAEEETLWLQQQWQKPFDLQKGPLLRCSILITGRQQLLSFNMHHIISDGWSVVVLYRDVMNAYRSLTSLQPLSLQYKDFTAWQRAQLQGEKLDQYRHFWKELFKDPVQALELPVDFLRPAVKTYEGTTYSLQIGAAITQKIKQLSHRSGATLFMTLMTGIAVLLKKYANQNEVVIGTPVAGREHPQLQDQIGFYVNTLPIRIRMNGQQSFESLLNEAKEIILSAFEYQAFPFELLLEELQLKRDLSRSPLFDVMVVLQNITGLQAKEMRHVTQELTLERITIPQGITKYDLTFTFTETGDHLSLELEYNTRLFKQDTIERLSAHLVNLFEQVTTTSNLAIRDIVLLTPQESLLLASKADQTHISYDTSATIISLFEQAVHNHPERVAIKTAHKSVTYRELDQRSGQLAHILLRDYQLQPEELVLLHFERSEWMLIGILAVLKAGAAYVPVDPAYPAARISYILDDSGSSILLYDVLPAAVIQDTILHCIDVKEIDYTGDMAVTAIKPQQLAYVIYTSGTTGNPKGVLIEHHSVVRLLFNDKPLFDFDAADNWSLFHSYCFDFSVWEMYGALLYGGCLTIVPKEIAQDSIAFYDFIQEEKITVLNQTPTAFRGLVQSNQSRFREQPVSVRYLIFGGEALKPEILREWEQAFPGCKNVNMYGITETTVHVTYKEITITEIKENKSNIGLPIPTLSCYVLDLDLQQVPAGVTGELCVGGAGVARGYLNKHELTAQKFIDKQGEKLYRSGDFARILLNGDIEYIGRKDEQVKIRGHRIETGEIETVLQLLEGIRDAVVIPMKVTGDEYDLVAYFIPEEGHSYTHLRQQLGDKVPAYMVPAYLIALSAFPLNNNGKLDKSALPRPQEVTERQTLFVPARNETDRDIVAIWEAILEKENIGIRDNFFDLGGHSLKATRVISRIHEEFGIKMDLKNLFIDPTVEHLSNYIDTIRWMEQKNEVMTTGDDELIF